MELLTLVTVIPASLGVALLLQLGALKAILWVLHSRSEESALHWQD
jgi:hypothetical protein